MTNTARIWITSITLPDDGAVGHHYTIEAKEHPAVVNGKWRLSLGEKATFESYKWPWPFNKTLRWKCVSHFGDKPGPR
jgi:hypothetical protein